MSYNEEEIKKQAIANSMAYLICEANAALTIDAIHNESMDVRTLIRDLNESFERVKDDNFLEVEAMLLSQAHTLNIFFHRCLTKAANMEMVSQIQTFSNLALQAQNNCRKTLLTLAEVKNPKRSTFIGQQNNAIGNQQINNSENLKKSANEVLTETQNATLDDRRAETTITINPTLETMETINRGKNK